MDEEEDDFYDPVDSVPATQAANHGANAAPGQPQENDDMEEEEVEVESDEVGDQCFSFRGTCLPFHIG